MLSRDRISCLAALSLLFSALELFVPRFLPFFRLGLANIPLLMALDMSPASFAALVLLKGIGTSYISGNLFSLFALVSIGQSLASGAAMYVLSRLFSSSLSIYGISLAGALTSTLSQLLLISLYAGSGTLAFMPLMLFLSIPSAILTAALSAKIPEPVLQIPEEGNRKQSAYPIVLLVISGSAMMMTEKPLVLCISVLLAFFLQKRMGRRILLLPHLTMLLFMLVSALFTPHGEVLFRILSYPVTDGALLDGVSKSLRLSGGIALSQAFSPIIRPEKGVIGKTLSIFTQLLSRFQNTQGSLWSRFIQTLNSAEHMNMQKTIINIPYFTLTLISLLITALAFIDCVFF